MTSSGTAWAPTRTARSRPARATGGTPKLPPLVCNIDSARAELAAGGYVKGADGKLRDVKGNAVKFTLLTNAENQSRIDVAGLVRKDLEKLGIEVVFHAGRVQCSGQPPRRHLRLGRDPAGADGRRHGSPFRRERVDQLRAHASVEPPPEETRHELGGRARQPRRGRRDHGPTPPRASGLTIGSRRSSTSSSLSSISAIPRR